MENIVYRDYTISYYYKCVPNHDWEYAHLNYDGAPDSNDNRCGTAATLEDCKRDIDNLIEEML